MEQKEVQNLIDILEKSYKAIIDKDVKTIRELSNHTIHSSTINQDFFSISTAVILYSFSKIFERNYNEYKGWNEFYNNTKFFFKKSIQALRKNNFDEYKKDIKEILYSINKLDKKLKNYISDVIESAKISKASRMYEHGISIGRTVELLGINEWELMDYVGKTGISETELTKSKNVADRLKYTREMFNE